MKELQQMLLDIKKDQNKESESYPNVSFMSTVHTKREGVPKRAICTKKRNERRKKLRCDIDQKTLESKKPYIKNLSDYELTRDQINLLSRGLKFIPTPVVSPLNVITTLNVIPTANVIKINSKCNTNRKCNKNQP